MMTGLARGANVYYRGYVIHEDIKTIYYTIYGKRPDRIELSHVSNFVDAMQWIDRDITGTQYESFTEWPEIFVNRLEVANTVS